MQAFVGGVEGWQVEVLGLYDLAQLAEREKHWINKYRPTLNRESQPVREYTPPSARGKVTVREAAKLKGVTRQAIHAAVKIGKLHVQEIEVKTTAQMIDLRELEQWQPRQPNGHNGNGSKRKETK